MLLLYMSSSTFSQAKRKKIFLTTKWIKHRGRDASIMYALLCWKSCKNRRKWPTCTEGTYAGRQSITELQGIEKGPNKQGGKKKNFLTSSAESSGSSAMVWPVAGFSTSNIVALCPLRSTHQQMIIDLRASYWILVLPFLDHTYIEALGRKKRKTGNGSMELTNLKKRTYERCTLKNRSCDWKDLLAAMAIVFLASTITIWEKIADQSCNWRFPKFLGLLFYATLTRQGITSKILEKQSIVNILYKSLDDIMLPSVPIASCLLGLRVCLTLKK